MGCDQWLGTTMGLNMLGQMRYSLQSPSAPFLMKAATLLYDKIA